MAMAMRMAMIVGNVRNLSDSFWGPGTRRVGTNSCGILDCWSFRATLGNFWGMSSGTKKEILDLLALNILSKIFRNIKKKLRGKVICNWARQSATT